jgi:hypothetical protein
MNRKAKKFLSVNLACLAAGLAVLTTSAQTASTLGNLPLYFEANRGQANVAAQFIARGPDSQFLISSAGAQMFLRKSTTGIAAVRMQFIGANPSAQIRGEACFSGKINYLVGSDPAQWHSDIPTFAKVSVEEIYPGIGLVYYGNQRQLEYDFTIAPGANPNAIAIRFDGANKISVNAQGELVLTLSDGDIRQPKPIIYQTVGDARKAISGGYKILDAHSVAFSIGQYDRALPLVIDPTLSFSTYFGGNAGDTAWAVAVNTNDGSVYIAGQTLSKQFYLTPSAFQTNFAGGKLTGDAFVAKFDSTGQYLLYMTYLGGSGDDVAYGLAVDGAGNAYIAGATDSTNFPTANAIYPHISGPYYKSFGTYAADAFVAELNPGGSNLVYSTYLGGESSDAAYGIAVDSAGNAYVTGFTYSTNFPTTNAIQNHLACTNSVYFNANAFVSEIASGGSNLVFSTYFGGTNFDQGQGITVDNAGYIYVTGYTDSTNFPTYNPLYPRLNGSTNKINSDYDAFVVKLPPFSTNWIYSASNQVYSISNLVYSTYLGGTNNDIGRAIACDTAGDAFVTGYTTSTNFPDTATNVPGLYSFVATNRTAFLATNAFLTEINSNGTALVFSTLFGGRGDDVGNGVAVDPAGEVFVTGSASSTNFPVYNVPGFMRATNSGKSDAFVIGFNTNGPALLYSGYLGGKSDDFGYGIAVDASGNAYIAGTTDSTNFPTVNPGQPHRNGTNDVFWAEILLTVPLPEITSQPTNQAVGVGSTAQLDVGVSGTAPLIYQWQFDGMNLVNGGSISGATNSQLMISNAQTNNGGFYSLIITNNGGSVTSSYAILTVTNVPPAIIVQPTSQTNGVGTTVTLAVIASGTPPLSYQWQVDGTNLVNGGPKNGPIISGATTNVLKISNVQLTNNGTYTVIITNLAGSVTSSNAVLTVISAPEITVQPTNQSLAVGSTATFAVTATGMAPLSYRWQLNGTNLVNGGPKNGPIISGATADVLTINNAQTTNSGNYTVVVTNIDGSAISSNAVLVVTNVPPAIIVQPIGLTNGVGTTVFLGVFATGTAPLSYQWQVNGTNLVNGGPKKGSIVSGATTNVLKISNVQLTNSGNYTVIVTNVAGSVISSNAVLTVLSAPVITMQPTGQSLAVGSTATFAVTAIGMAPLSYHWQLNGTNLVNGGPKNGPTISGATADVLTISNTQTTNSGNYTVVVTNIDGSATSSNAVLTVTNTPPTIIVQPTSQTNGAGADVTLTVAATGTSPLSYQWQVNGTNLANGGQFSGATTNMLTISDTQTTNSGSYTVIVTNFGGSATSSNAVLTVTNIPPTITVQPKSQSIESGSNVTFAVTATGTGPLSYQWQVNGTNLVNGGSISGATTNVLKISNVQTNNSGSYTVIVTNLAGSVTSSNAVLTVLSAPVITMQPTNQLLAAGSTATFAVTAIGIAPLRYHWQVNGANLANGGQISGATASVLTISNTQTTNSGNYTVIVTNVAGSVTSSNAVLTVTNVPPAITVQPISQTNGAGTTVTLAVTATGTAPLSYQWQVNGTNLMNGGSISGATTNVLKISNVQTNNSGSYTVIVTNLAGSVISSNAVLTVLSAPVITMQPASQSLAVGSTATFAVTAIGMAPLSYHWQLNGTNLVNGGHINGATADVLTISNTQTTNSGNYTVIVTNVAGSATSFIAILTVTNIPPTITVQPTNQSLVAGANVTLTVAATGTAPLSYQWQVDGTNLANGGSISGAITSVLKIRNAQTNNSGSYSVVVTNYGGSATSSIAVLTVASSPVILVQPTNQTVVVGSAATFAVTAIGIAPLSYQWQVNGTNLVNGGYNGGYINGATTNVLTFGNVQLASSGNYTVIITNMAGSVTSSNAVLTVTNVPPAITVQPTNQTVAVGTTVTLAVTATGTAPLSYQWQLDETNLMDGTNMSGSIISGSTNATLTITNAQASDSGSYSVVVTNVAGSVTSSNAVLSVVIMAPIFENIIAVGDGNFILSGNGGLSNGTYYVLTSSNLVTPLGQWTLIATNQFDSQGQFIFTNTAPTNTPQLFYILQMQSP